MNRKSWSLSKSGPIRLDDKNASDTADTPQSKNHAVPKAALEEGILQLLASAAEMQQRQDFDSALQLYEAAMEKVKAHGLNRKRLFTGTSKKPAPLNHRTPIQWCLHVGDISSAICLLGSPNAALAELRTSVTCEKVGQILDAGADIEYRLGPMGRTLLLQEAAEGRHAGVRLALDRGASVTVMDDNGDTALALVLLCGKSQSSQIVADLMDAGADINSQDGQGQPLFKLAIAQGQPEVVLQIMEVISPFSTKHWECMIRWAAGLPMHGDKWSNRTCEVLRLLLDKGLDPNLCLQPNGNVALLEVAVQRQAAGSELLVADLLNHGAAPNLEAALNSGITPNIEVILKKVTPLQDARQEQIMAWMTNLPLEPSAWAPRYVDALKLLLDYGLDPNLCLLAAPHSPLIVCAAASGSLPLVQKLIALKAQLNGMDDNSNTALICAAKTGNRPIYDALKKAGVNDRIFFGMITVWSSHQNAT